MIVPNSVISSEILINSSIVDELICNFVDIGISYDSDLDKVIEIIRNEAESYLESIDNRTKDEKKNGVLAVRVRVMGFGDSSVNLRAFVWSKDHSSGIELKSDLNKSIKEQFDRNGIEIPFPYLTIVYKDK